MILRNFKLDDFDKLIKHSSNILNYNSIAPISEEFNKLISQYSLNNIIDKATYGIVLEENDDIVGVLLARVNDGSKYLISDKNINLINCSKIIKELESEKTSNDELALYRLELRTIEGYKQIIEDVSRVVGFSSELLFFSVLPSHQKRGLSKVLFNKFLKHLKSKQLHRFYLFTTSLCSYNYYEYIKMSCVRTEIITKQDSDTYLVNLLKNKLPMTGMIFHADVKNFDDDTYAPINDPVIDEILVNCKEESNKVIVNTFKNVGIFFKNLINRKNKKK